MIRKLIAVLLVLLSSVSLAYEPSEEAHIAMAIGLIAVEASTGSEPRAQFDECPFSIPEVRALIEPLERENYYYEYGCRLYRSGGAIDYATITSALISAGWTVEHDWADVFADTGFRSEFRAAYTHSDRDFLMLADLPHLNLYVSLLFGPG